MQNLKTGSLQQFFIVEHSEPSNNSLGQLSIFIFLLCKNKESVLSHHNTATRLCIFFLMITSAIRYLLFNITIIPHYTTIIPINKQELMHQCCNYSILHCNSWNYSYYTLVEILIFAWRCLYNTHVQNCTGH